MAGRGGTSKSKGSMGKGGGRKKKYGSGAIGELKKRRAARQAAGKWTLGEKLTERGRKAAKARKQKRQAAKVNKPLKRVQAGKAAAGTGTFSTKKSRAKAIGAKAGTVVQRKAVKKVSTKGGDYVKYEKKSKAAKSFRAAYGKACGGKAGPGGTFKWDGRSYSCASAGPKKAKKPIVRGGAKASDPA